MVDSIRHLEAVSSRIRHQKVAQEYRNQSSAEDETETVEEPQHPNPTQGRMQPRLSSPESDGVLNASRNQPGASNRRSQANTRPANSAKAMISISMAGEVQSPSSPEKILGKTTKKIPTGGDRSCLDPKEKIHGKYNMLADLGFDLHQIQKPTFRLDFGQVSE